MKTLTISEYQILKSNAGYYVGRTQGGEPFDRISDYGTHAEMEEMMNEMKQYMKVLPCGCIFDTYEFVHYSQSCPTNGIHKSNEMEMI